MTSGCVVGHSDISIWAHGRRMRVPGVCPYCRLFALTASSGTESEHVADAEYPNNQSAGAEQAEIPPSRYAHLHSIRAAPDSEQTKSDEC